MTPLWKESKVLSDSEKNVALPLSEDDVKCVFTVCFCGTSPTRHSGLKKVMRYFWVLELARLLCWCGLGSADLPGLSLMLSWGRAGVGLPQYHSTLLYVSHNAPTEQWRRVLREEGRQILCFSSVCLRLVCSFHIGQDKSDGQVQTQCVRSLPKSQGGVQNWGY